MNNDKLIEFLQNNSLNDSVINIQDINKFNEFVHYDLILEI